MKVLCVHNYYGSEAPSGENVAYDCEVALLEKYGHEVMEFTASSDGLRARPAIGKIVGAFSCIWNALAVQRLRRIVRAELPDILHVHNVFPRFSPAILAAAKGTATAVVHTLHNYRLFCAAGTAVRNHRGCKDCADQRSVVPALIHRCYRGSIIATAPVAASIALHRWTRTMSTHVDAFVTLTEFQRELLAAAKLLPSGRVHVRPNFMPGSHVPLPLMARTPRIVYVGRLSPEKGADILIKAWKQWGSGAPTLTLIGDGSSRGALEELAIREIGSGQIKFLGQLPFEETLNIVRDSRILVVPSLCFEGFPMVIREAFALGVAVVASDVGALPQIVSGRGAVFAAGDPVALGVQLRKLWRDASILERLSKSAHDAYLADYSEGVAHVAMLRIYEAARSHRLSKSD